MMPDIYVTNMYDMVFLWLAGVAICSFAYGLIAGVVKALRKKR